MSRLKKTRCFIPAGVALGLAACSHESGTALKADQDYVNRAQRPLAGMQWHSDDVSSDNTVSSRDRKDYSNLWDRVFSLYALPPMENQRIDRELRWLAQKTDFIQNTQERARLYLHYIVEEFERNGFPGEIALLPVIESGFQPRANSTASAVGIWQFIPSTGRLYGLDQNRFQDERRDVYESTRAAIRFFKKLQNDFSGDWLLSLAAYNCGERCVQNAVAKNLRQELPTDYWSLDLPEETRAYVPRLLAVARLFANARRYNIELLPIADRPVFEPVYVGSQIDLKLAAELADTPMTQFLKLNPSFNGSVTSPHGPHRLLIPTEKCAGFKEKIAQLAPEMLVPKSLPTFPGAPAVVASLEQSSATRYPAVQQATQRFIRHAVKRGETLTGIAAKYGVTPATVRAINRLRGGVVLAGSVLTIPTRAVGSSQPAKSSIARPKIVQKSASSHPIDTIHVVRRGESLTGLARRYGVSVAELARWNGIRVNARLVSGQKVVLRNQEIKVASVGIADVAPPLNQGAARGTKATSAGNVVDRKSAANKRRSGSPKSTKHKADRARALSYVVRRGDTFHSISRQFNVSLTDLRKWNGLRGETLKAGQRITVVLQSDS